MIRALSILLLSLPLYAQAGKWSRQESTGTTYWVVTSNGFHKTANRYFKPSGGLEELQERLTFKNSKSFDQFLLKSLTGFTPYKKNISEKLNAIRLKTNLPNAT